MTLRLKMHIFAGCLIIYKKTLNFESVNALAEIEVSFIKQKRFYNL